MTAFASTLAVLQTTTEASSGLPTVCAQRDDTLFRWSTSIVNAYWPHEDPWVAHQRAHFHCDPDGPDGAEEQACAPEGTMLCLYGIISAMACSAVMFAHNAADVPEWSEVGVRSAASLELILESRDKVLEFLDSSTWPFTVEDLAALVDAYGRILRSQGGQARGMILPEAASSRPWTVGSPGWREAEEAALHSLAMVAAWTWPPPAAGAPPGMGAAARRGTGRLSLVRPLPVRLWAFGTHCAVLAEPVSALALLFPGELQLEVTWRGTRDYCGLNASAWPAPAKDEGSPAARVLEAAVRMFERGSEGADGRRPWDADANRRTALRARGDATALADPQEFREALQAALRQDSSFRVADLGLCSEPAYACLAMHDAGKPVIGYFGVHIGFMLRTGEEQLGFYRAFRDSLAVDPRNTFATVAPYVSLQLLHHTSVEVPAARPLSLYTQPATYTAAASQEVLVNKRPIAFWDVAALLDTFSRLNGEAPLRFADAAQLADVGRASYAAWAAFRAAVYFPYDWLQTMTFYDWLAIGLPTFVPDTPMHTFAVGTNPRREQEALAAKLLYSHHWDAAVWSAPREVYPHHYGDWHDLPGRVYWWLLTDFHALPGVGLFSSVADLLARLASQDALWAASSRLRASHLQRTASGALFWRGALARALA